MSGDEAISLIISFQDMPDPRVAGRCDHKLIDIIVITVCAMIAGAESWVDVESFGQAKQEWLRTFLDLPHGVPSHDTFGRFFATLDAEAFQTAFMRWVEGVFRVSRGQVIAIDGKTVRRSHDRTIGKDAIHMVNAWATHNGIALGQLICSTAMPKPSTKVTDASKFGGAGPSATRSRLSRSATMKAGPISRRLCVCSVSDACQIRPKSTRLTTSAACPPRLTHSWMPRAFTGRLKTVSTGSWT